MQNQNENDGFRKIDRYPNYEIDTCGRVRSVRNKKDVPFLKRNDKRGLAQVSLRVNNNKHKETVMDLMEETFTAREIMGDLAYDEYVNNDILNEDTDKPIKNIFGDDYIDPDSSDEDESDEQPYVCDDESIDRDLNDESKVYDDVWIDGVHIARNEVLVADYLSYLPAPLYKNPCMAWMTAEQEDHYRYQLDRYHYPNVYKYI